MGYKREFEYFTVFNCIYLLYFTCLVLFTYAYFFGDENAKGLGGVVTRLVFEKFPRWFRATVSCCGGVRAESAALGCWDYCANQRNPLVQILYLCLVNGAFFGWLFVGEPLLGKVYLVPSKIHSTIGYIGISICQISFFMACRNEPHKLTPDNIREYRGDEPYDKLLYLEKSFCKACNIVRPPRSKHCSLCQACISHFDHHCIWLNQCVSYKNLNTFMLFLFVHIVFLTYASVIVALILLSEVYEQDLMSRSFVNPVTGETYSATYYIVFTYILSRHSLLFSIFLLIAVLSISFFVFFAYHCSLIYKGTTTNESYKWSNVRNVYDYLKKLGVSKYVPPENSDDMNDRNNNDKNNSNDSSSNNNYSKNNNSKSNNNNNNINISSSNSSSRSFETKPIVLKDLEDLNIGCIGSGAIADSSTESSNPNPNLNASSNLASFASGPSDGGCSHNKVHSDRDPTTVDPNSVDPTSELVEADFTVNMVLQEEFERVKHYKHVIRYVIDNAQMPVISEVDVGDFPVNIYDRGIFGNFKQALTGYHKVMGGGGGGGGGLKCTHNDENKAGKINNISNSSSNSNSNSNSNSCANSKGGDKGNKNKSKGISKKKID